MIPRHPLTEIQNVTATQKKVQRTYGKKGKMSTAMASAKDIFVTKVTTEELESSLGKMSLAEIGGDQVEKVMPQVRKEIEVIEEDTPPPEVKPRPVSVRRIRRLEAATLASTTQETPQTTKKSTSKSSKPSSCTKPVNTPPTTQPQTEDDLAIHKFASEYSDHPILPFTSYGTTIAKKYDVEKVGEGTYSSVFALTRRSTPSTSTSASTPNTSQCSSTASTATSKSTCNTRTHKTTILKLMPILPPSSDPASPANHGMTSPSHIACELRTMRTMSPIHGFIRYRGLLIVRGAWPANFLGAFREFGRVNRKKAVNEDPEDLYSGGGGDGGGGQYFALVEMEDAGGELSDVYGLHGVGRPSMFVVNDVFWQVAVFLAWAEEGVGFEHRDLHVSNICVRAWEEGDGSGAGGEGGGSMDVSGEMVGGMTERPGVLLGLSGVATTLIDYTFSRVRLDGGKREGEGGVGVHEGEELQKTSFREFVIEGLEYDALLKKTLREKQTNSGERFEDRMQQLTYAKVSKIVNHVHEKAEQDGTAHDPETGEHITPWQHPVPRSNVCWLGYLITCLLGRSGKTAKTKYVPGSNELAKAVQDEIREKMIELKELLLEEEFEQMPRSAADVVRIGVERGWLGVRDIEKFKERLEEEEC